MILIFTVNRRGAENAGVENAGVEKAGVEKAGAITYGKPSEQKTLKTPGVQAKTKRSQPVFEQCS